MAGRQAPSRFVVAALVAVFLGTLSPFATTGVAVEPPPSSSAAPTPSEPSPTSEPTGPPSPTPSSSPAPDPEEPSTDPAEPFPLPTGQPIEVPDPTTAEERVALRTETSRTFDLGGGKFVTELFTEQVFYRPGGDGPLEPIDLTFRGDGTRAIVDRSPVSVRVGAAARGEPVLVLAGQSGFSIAYHPLVDGSDLRAVSDAVARSGAVADLAEILPEIDLRVVARADGANVFLVLDHPPAASPWTFALDLPAGATLVPDEYGGVEVRDAAGAPRARIDAPWAVDSTPDELTGSGRMTSALHYEIGRLGDGRHTLTVVLDDLDWLADAIYPVYVDPSTTLVGPGSNTYGDAHINEGNPNQNYANYQRPDSPTFYELWLGESPSDPTYVNHALIKFDLSSVAGKAVDAAELRLRPYHAYYDAPTERGIWVRRIGSEWYESTVTWGLRPSKTSNAQTDQCAESTTLSCLVDVTYWTRTWLDGLNTNWGFWVDTNGNNETFWKRLISAEQAHSTSPRLYVEYHDPVSVVYPASGPTSSRTLSWTTDPTWGQQAYELDVSLSNAFGSFVAQSGTQSGSATSWGIPIGTGLTAGTTYYWRVRAQATNGAWSVWTTGQFTWDPGLLGLQDHHRYESWDLGGGDTLVVDASTLNAVVSHPIVSLPYRGGSLDLALTYNAQDPDDAGFGRGWRFSHGRRLAVNATTGAVTFLDADGSRHTFTNPSGSGTLSYTRPATVYATLTRNTTATPDRFTLTYRDGSKDTFDELATNIGHLVREEDRHGNGINLTYSGTTPTTLTDPAGRTVGLTWASGHVTQIVDWANVSGGIVQTSGSGNRTHRFFYSGSTLSGWAGPLNTSSTCATGGSHLTCLTYDAKSYVWKIAKTQTYTTLTTGTLGTGTRTVTTEIDQAGTGEVRGVRDAEQFFHSGTANTFTRTAGLVEVVRRGSPDATIRYAVPAATDPYARITSVKRKLGASWIEQLTAYNGTYPIEPASVTENQGALLSTPARTTSYTYVASSLGLLQKVVEPLTATDDRWTEYVYNANNDVTQQKISLEGASPVETRYIWVANVCSSNVTLVLQCSRIDNYKDGSAGGVNGHVEDVPTAYQYDDYGQQTRETRSNYSGSTLLDQRALGYEYDGNGNLTKEILNYVDGNVDHPSDDTVPNASTNARTDLTTVHAYDTAGNRVSSADPRRAIEAEKGTSLVADDYAAGTTYDALNRPITETLPRDPFAAECTPAPACRQATTTYDELGLVRSGVDHGGKVSAAAFDRAGRSIASYEDDDATAGGARITGTTTYHADGAVYRTEDAEQANDGGASLGYTEHAYDELGRTSSTKAAAGTVLVSTTSFGYDALDRQTSVTSGTESGAAQTTVTRYDVGGRATEVDDEFTCTTTSYDYRDLATSRVEGKAPGNPCTGTSSRTVNDAYDGLGRRTSSVVAGGATLEAVTYDGAGNRLATSSTSGTITETSDLTYNALDQVTREYRKRFDSGTSTTSNEAWTRQNYDAAGNQTDRCTWTAAPSENCKAADQTMGSPQPVTRSTSAYDARNQRVSLKVPGRGETTYDPSAGYQVDRVYVTTMTDANGATIAEHVTDYEYDTRDRLETITQQACLVTAGTHTCTSGTVTTGATTYGLDEVDNRTSVVEDNGAASTTRYYCYDARHQLTNAGTTNCTTGSAETYAYDAAGNRTSAAGDTFVYSEDGRLCLIDTGGPCPFDEATWDVTYDDDGRTAKVIENGTTWSYLYDGEGRMVSACKAASCSGSGFARLDFAYDGEGRRTRLTETTAGGTPTVTTTDFRYDGERVVGETTSSGISRTFTVDESGAIVKLTIAGDAAVRNGDYLVVWNGHGDALGLWKIDSTTGALTVANTYAYSTWGTPTVTTHGNFADLGFRYLYVGRHDVQWDNFAGAGLHYMHARHYRASLGRFLQPDPADIEANLYGYAENSPVTKLDPTGEECENTGSWNCIGGARANSWFRNPRHAKGGRFNLGGDLARQRYGTPRYGTSPQNTRTAKLNALKLLREEIFSGSGIPIAGRGARGVPIHDIARIVRTYGGRASDWSKMTTPTHYLRGGKVQAHWYQHKSGRIVEIKYKWSWK